MSVTNTNAESTTQVTEVKVQLTRIEKLLAQAKALHARIEKDTAAYEEIRKTVEAINAIASVKEGDTVKGTYGRADTARSVEGRVLGVSKDEAGKVKVKAVIGSGFDTEVLVLDETNITEVIPVAVEAV
jgi:hypothetical protein